MFLPVFAVALLCQTATSFSIFSRTDAVDADFNLFILTQWWPQTMCYDQMTEENFKRIKMNQTKSCVPEGVTKWTIHGLWPTIGTEHKPAYCNESWPFSESVIQDLLPKLERQWPTLESGQENAEFWKHEWDKHGTCSTNIPFLNSEHKYFTTTLSLNVKYDLYSILKQSGIVPSDDATYQVKEIQGAFFDFFRVRFRMTCYKTEGMGQMLDSVELCLDKTDLSLIDCQDSNPDCDFSKPVQYPPIIYPSDLV